MGIASSPCRTSYVVEVNFVEMAELLPEVWMSDEEELPSYRNVLVMPKKKVLPITGSYL